MEDSVSTVKVELEFELSAAACDDQVEDLERAGDDLEASNDFKYPWLPAESPGSYRIVGPERPVELLTKAACGELGRLCGRLSPVNKLMVPSAERAAGGIPQRAVSMCFVHPLAGAQEMLAKADLSMAKDSWAWIALFGGFAFFDASATLVGTRAIAVGPTGPSCRGGGFSLSGPFEASAEALEALRAQGRMHPVTLAELRDVGLDSVGWVFAKELQATTLLALR